MRGGALDRLIGICRYQDGEDAYGDAQPGFAAAVPTPARIRHLPGTERLQAAENAATAPTVFQIRWTPEFDPAAPGGLNAKDQIEYPLASGRMLDVTSAIEVGRHDTIEIAATGRAD